MDNQKKVKNIKGLVIPILSKNIVASLKKEKQGFY